MPLVFSDDDDETQNQSMKSDLSDNKNQQGYESKSIDCH